MTAICTVSSREQFNPPNTGMWFVNGKVAKKLFFWVE
jgi:hypothetical protein